MINSFINVLLIIGFIALGNAEPSGSIKGTDGEDKVVKLIRNDTGNKVDVFIGGRLFTSYLYSNTLKKPVLYPVKTAGGTLITRGFPLDPRPGERTDHPHHVGLWFNYGDVNGLDFWNNSDSIPDGEKSSYGTIRHKEIKNISSGDTKGELKVRLEWVNAEGELLLEENTTFIFSGKEKTRRIDRITKLTAPDKNISMKDNKEGMLGMRMARELEHPEESDNATGKYRSSEGVEGIEVWGTRAKWMNLAGLIKGDSLSVAIFDHPDNIGYPTYWHARGYGLYAANPLGQKALSEGKEELNFKLSAGESVTFKHRIEIYSGEKVTPERIDSDWADFSR